mmetsp:Transcript_11509/g.22277  ORF Transcript_11509/g.22277 Transcript_11509/m.22277 type:complete len:477 (+) Transcript_11509:75-1505(+)
MTLLFFTHFKFSKNQFIGFDQLTEIFSTMPLSVNTSIAVSKTHEETCSPLGKRKSGGSYSDRSPKRSPLSNVGNATNLSDSSKNDKIASTPLKRYSFGTHSTPYSATKFKSRVSKDEVQATNEGRASVHKLSEWLATESAKKEKPKRIVPCPTATAPLRFRAKPKISKEDVQATDDKRVSVKTLSEWISDDPFEQRKIRQVRSGAKVIARSRAFETDQVADAAKTVEVKLGSVHEKQAWLSGAFKQEKYDGRPKPAHPVDKLNNPRPYQNKPKKVEESPEKVLKSVNEKKEWLKNAFKGKEDQKIKTTKSLEKAEHPMVLKCASADEAHCARKDFPAVITQRASCDGMSTPYKDAQEPVRFYQNLHPGEEERPEKTLKSVHNKQEWLSNALKKPKDIEHVVERSKLVAKHVQAPIEKPAKDESKQTEINVCVSKDSSSDQVMLSRDAAVVNNLPDTNVEEKISVADRAKWLREAFK